MNSPLEWMERLPMHQPLWLFIFLFVLLAFYAWIRSYYGNILVQSLQAGANFQVASRMFKDNSLLQSQLSRLMFVLYFLSFAGYFYVLEVRFGVEPFALEGFYLFLFNLGILVAFLFARVVLLHLLGSVFDRLRLFREFLYHGLIYNKLLGVALLPFLVFLLYTRGGLGSVFFYLSTVVVLGVIGMRSIRGLVFSFKKGVSGFYMILYLCALEMAPLVLLYRWLEGIL